MTALDTRLRNHQHALASCRQCPKMIGTPVYGEPVASRVLLVGQAPGSREAELHRPFAWTAGKTLFAWFASIGLSEAQFRSRVYMAAVCRCFPGKATAGGDRVPSRQEISTCSVWLNAELALLKPALLIPVGRLAIEQFLPAAKLDTIIGRSHEVSLHGRPITIIALPHPSGASVWHRVEPGKTLLAHALRSIAAHPAWAELCRGEQAYRTHDPIAC
jgi:uracil-DNA glycosylase